MPKVITQELKPDGKLGGEVDRVSRGGIFREVEVALMMDRSVAKSLSNWLNKNVEKLGEVSGEENE